MAREEQKIITPRLSVVRNDPRIGDMALDGLSYYMGQDKTGEGLYVLSQDGPEMMNWSDAEKYAATLSAEFNKKVFVLGENHWDRVSCFVRKHPGHSFSQTFDHPKARDGYWEDTEIFPRMRKMRLPPFDTFQMNSERCKHLVRCGYTQKSGPTI